MGERCSDDKALLDYGICHDFIKQVALLPTAQRWTGGSAAGKVLLIVNWLLAGDRVCHQSRGAGQEVCGRTSGSLRRLSSLVSSTGNAWLYRRHEPDGGGASAHPLTCLSTSYCPCMH